MNRTLNVVRMQLNNRQTFIWLPLIILGAAFAVNWIIWSLIPVDEPKFGGGAQAPLWYFLVVGIQALTLTFPFSQAMSVTRREFFLGTILTAGLTSAILSGVFIAGGFVETATGGWGVNGYFFSFPWIWEFGAGGAALFYLVLALLFFVIGLWSAIVFKRFGALWLTVSLVVLGLLLVGGVWLITQWALWGSVFTWFATTGVVILSLWGLLLTAVLGMLCFATFRRMTP
ncbi:hypothetical protein GCM10009808_22070 [Microbacterium sediminicola]|uniref:ABC transporter permease n=1 Tax=Microbacterium sediminicola TaxID=415210 RepID=A0ABN2IEY6_9MICO